MVPAPPPPADALLERDHALDAVRATLDAPGRGTGAVLLLSGAAGVGKTSLLDLARVEAEQRGAAVLAAACAPLEQAYSFGAVRQLLRPHRAEGDDVVTHGLLADVPSGAADPFAVLEALHRRLVRLADERAVALLVDDVHWCDEPSLRWLGFVVRRLVDLPVAVLLTTRPVDADGQGYAALVTHPAVRRIDLVPLSGAASAQLLRARARVDLHDDLAAQCHSATGGNPFYLDVLACAARELGPERLQQALVEDEGLLPARVRRGILDRLVATGPASLQVARAAAVLGARADASTIAAVLDLPPDRVGEGVRAAVACGVLAGGPPLSFPHPLVRAAVEESLDPEEADALHRRAARHLVATSSDVERAASHLVRTRPQDELWVLETLRAAAQHALQRGAPDTAAGYLRRAVAEPLAHRSAELLLELGCAELAVGDGAGQAHLSEALGLSRDDPTRARAARALARSLALAGRAPEAVDVLQRAQQSLTDPDGDDAARLDLDLAACGDLDLSTRPVAGAALDRRRACGTGPLGRLVQAHLALQAARAGTPACEVAAQARAALADGALFRDEGLESRVAFYPVIALVLSDELDEARRHVTEVAEEARRSGSTPGSCLAALWRSHALLRAGDVDAAGRDAEAALSAAQEAGLTALQGYARSFLSDVLVERAELDGAEALWGARGLDAALPLVLPSNYVLFSRGALHLARGRVQQAVRDLLESGRRQRLWQADGVGFWPWRSLAALGLRQLGDAARAEELVEEELAAARAFGAARPLGMALRAQGLLLRGAERVTALQEAVDVLAASPARLEHARALADLGTALVRRARQDDGAALLVEAHRRASECGATGLVRRTSAELEAIGARTRTPGSTGLGALTVSERRVARLAARGWTNRQIAQELFVTLKTVETHLSHAFRKLGISGRAELVDVEGLGS